MTTLLDGVTADAVTAEALLRPLGQRGLFARADRWQQRYATTLFIGDALTCFASIVVTSLLVTDDKLTAVGVGLLIATLPVWLMLLTLNRSYDKACIGVGSEEFRRVGTAGLHMMALVAVIGYGLHLAIPRSLVAIVLPVTVGLSLVQHATGRHLLSRARAHGQAQHAVVVVGTPDSALGLVMRLQENTRGAFKIANVCASDVVDVAEVLHAVRATGADTVAVATSSGLSTNELRRLGWELETTAVDLIMSTDLVEVAGPRIHIRPVAGLPLLHVDRPELSGAGRVIKGLFDRSAALLGLMFLSPLLLVTAIAVRRDSAGGALFRQTRVGKDGREFTVLKFRTMRAGADSEVSALADLNEHDGLLFKIKNDPRITGIGARLRRYSIDELPQLWNVVRGDMSLVGPRPPLPTEVAAYERDVRRRLLVKPGLTGLWQVSGRSDLSWDQSVRLDLNYVENWSFTGDMAILFRTAGAVLASKGAY